MKTGNRTLSALEDTYALRILVFLFENGPTFKTVLYSSVSNTVDAPKKRVETLVEIGLLSEDVSRYPPYTKTIDLTSKGRIIAEMLVEIEKELEK
jgi:DNA-binding HxlR family transcriptional regulator